MSGLAAKAFFFATVIPLLLWMLVGLVRAVLFLIKPAPNTNRFIVNPGIRQFLTAFAISAAVWGGSHLLYELGACEHGLKSPATCDYIPHFIGQLAFNLLLFFWVVLLYAVGPLLAISAILELITRFRR